MEIGEEGTRRISKGLNELLNTILLRLNRLDDSEGKVREGRCLYFKEIARKGGGV